ncbi:unnamed protein product [Acanthoscelides obtectus]|uniref:Uncharacterized protein n=1 Tax=Acanthoscelides obtectus TaxID=200917 RepID=A0A9P0L0W4_ACAOB|nr:unnamed protein product [Acanthoscelides obtectus]CAK1625578.1 hypothetical protein AOBTE_LOCUS3239 [Acanthoscelides obtectus]
MSVAAAGSGGPSQFQDHKMQQLKRMGVGSSEEDGLHTVTDLQANNLKMPGEKKGILKKQDFNVIGWVDNMRGEGVSSAAADEIMTQAEESIAQLMAGPGAQVKAEVATVMFPWNTTAFAQSFLEVCSLWQIGCGLDIVVVVVVVMVERQYLTTKQPLTIFVNSYIGGL